MNSLRANKPQRCVQFKVGNLVRITKQKVKLAKGYEQSFSTEIFRVVKVLQRVPQIVYELPDSQGRPIEGQFYKYELVRVTVSPQTDFQIRRTHNENGSKNILSSGEDTTRSSTLG